LKRRLCITHSVWATARRGHPPRFLNTREQVACSVSETMVRLLMERRRQVSSHYPCVGGLTDVRRGDGVISARTSCKDCVRRRVPCPILVSRLLAVSRLRRDCARHALRNASCKVGRSTEARRLKLSPALRMRPPRHEGDPHWGPKASLRKQRAVGAKSGCLRAISGQLDEQTLTVFIPVSASARVL
jgi:hypothetical protein